MPTLERSDLHVEGTDDVHAIKHLLLLRLGFDCPLQGDTRSDEEFLERVPRIKAAGNNLKVLEAMPAAVLVGNGRSVGFVLDADQKPENRRNAVRDRLCGIHLNPTKEIPEDGFIEEIAELKVRVGVWLMPDNKRSGALEDFFARPRR